MSPVVESREGPRNYRYGTFTLTWEPAYDEKTKTDYPTYWATPGISGCVTEPKMTPVAGKTWQVTDSTSITFKCYCATRVSPSVRTVVPGKWFGSVADQSAPANDLEHQSGQLCP
jgi:hypothetical protein